MQREACHRLRDEPGSVVLSRLERWIFKRCYAPLAILWDRSVNGVADFRIFLWMVACDVGVGVDCVGDPHLMRANSEG